MIEPAHQAAADFLLRTLTDSALPRLDDGREIFFPAITNSNDEAAVVFNVAGGKLAIIIGDYWRYPGQTCYFVNWNSDDRGSFRCGAGVNNVWAALLEIGQAIEFAHNAYSKA